MSGILIALLLIAVYSNLLNRNIKMSIFDSLLYEQWSSYFQSWPRPTGSCLKFVNFSLASFGTMLTLSEHFLWSTISGRKKEIDWLLILPEEFFWQSTILSNFLLLSSTNTLLETMNGSAQRRFFWEIRYGMGKIHTVKTPFGILMFVTSANENM